MVIKTHKVSIEQLSDDKYVVFLQHYGRREKVSIYEGAYIHCHELLGTYKRLKYEVEDNT